MRKLVIAVMIMITSAGFAGSATAEMVGALMPTRNVPYYMAIHEALVKELEVLGTGAQVLLQKPAPSEMAWKNATRKLVTLGAKVIVAYGSETALTIIEETHDVPVVYTAAYDPAGAGLSGKATGMGATIPLDGLIANLKKISNFSKLGILYSSDEATSVKQMEEATALALKLGGQVIKIDSNDSEAFDLLGSDAVLFTSSSAINDSKSLDSIIGDARSRKIVTASVMCASCQNGVLLSLSADPEHQGKGAARMVADILAGKKPGDIAANNDPQVQMTINLKEAKDLGVSIPFELLGTSKVVK